MARILPDRPLPELYRRRIWALISRMGERPAAKALDIGHATLARALAGLPLHRATADVLEARLSPPPEPA